MVRIETIGQGGLGRVDLYERADGKQYAVKQMLYAWDNNHYERFKREIKIMADLAHENIIKVLKFDINQNNPWYIMPYYQQGSLRDKINSLQSEGKVYSGQAASGVIYYLSKALHYAHRKGVIHRDLKPENILFEGRKPLIADWGIGKFIHRESTVLTYGGLGTKTYCSPEQWQSGISDHRSDIYSLGIIFRELLSGSVHGKIADEKINSIVNKMTMISPDDRYQSMLNVMEDIESMRIISTEDPLKDFAKGALVVAGVVGLAMIIASLFDD